MTVTFWCLDEEDCKLSAISVQPSAVSRIADRQKYADRDERQSAHFCQSVVSFFIRVNPRDPPHPWAILDGGFVMLRIMRD